MKKLSLEEMKESELETMVIFRDFCEKNNLRYYVAFGTLLGAARHHGFIPWDDDVDFYMPRVDYDFLIKNFNNSIIKRRELISKENTNDYPLNFAKIVDRNTVLYETGCTFKGGAWIDIFPLDYIKENKIYLYIMNRIIVIISYGKMYASIPYRKDRAWYKKPIFRIYQLIYPRRQWFERKREKYVRKIVSDKETCFYGFTHRDYGKYGVPYFKVNLMEPYEKLEFEGEQFRAPKEYERILSWIYGNYMELPPIEKQVSKHSYICYWNEEE